MIVVLFFAVIFATILVTSLWWGTVKSFNDTSLLRSWRSTLDHNQTLIDELDIVMQQFVIAARELEKRMPADEFQQLMNELDVLSSTIDWSDDAEIQETLP